MSVRTRRVLVILDLQTNDPSITQVSSSKPNCEYPPLRVGSPIVRENYRTVIQYTPEQMVSFRRTPHSISSIVSVFDKITMKRSASCHTPKPQTAVSENINSTSFIRSSLNKLCEANMAQILKEVHTQVRTLDDAKLVLTILFKKAVNERKYTSLYVRFYKELQLLTMTTRESVANEMPKILLDFAHEIFMKVPGEVDEEGKTQEEIDVMKFEFLGNVKLICELYKMKVVVEALPIFCMQQLVNGGLVALEALADLMKNVGRIRSDELVAIKNAIIRRVKEGKLSKRYVIILENGINALGFRDKLI
ncbi:hypothetical protein EIN_060990 [Entamoeba invadens IP1]|uniref:hypothetical protein n=1 Tax=Entamoeba invadens IP1 TaxID=370355 RepID=UPI0002C3CE26|nr:hypothetical protein EIN_060990 [Entamoeba invadens IP1]ELP93534.1 hypothetical protein EIN_060990 [Entamoeba invadens IP1]|eukprot:XP_004260305.1 hypothetical protein EIN_060990 [Entamoeba invadens IP1]